jgi:two-component sensor histidine kinase
MKQLLMLDELPTSAEAGRAERSAPKSVTLSIKELESRLKRISPARAIAGAFAVLVLAALTLFILHALNERADRYRAARGDAAIRSVMLAEHAERLLEGADLLLERIMELPKEQRWRWDAISQDPANYALLSRLNSRYDYLEALWLTDEGGRPRVTSRQFPAPMIDTSDREYFIAHRDHRGGPLLSRLIASRVTTGTNVVLSRRLEDDGQEFRGIAQAVLSPAFFLAFYQSLALPPGTEVTLIREDLSVVVRYPAVPDEVALRLSKWQEPPPGWGASTAADNRAVSAADQIERIESWRKIGRFPVYVAVGESVPEIEAGWRRAMLAQGALGGGALAVVGLLSLLAWRLAKREERLLADLEERVDQRTADLGAAVATRDLLLKEVHHRVKNNLQLVSSLLGLQSRRAADDGVRQSLEDASARVTAIAELHRNLYQGDRPNVVELSSYLQELCADLRTAGMDPNNRIDVSTEPMELPVDTVVPLALIVTEAVANALKHALVDGQAGRVSVKQRRQPDGGAVIEVADSGPGKRPDAPVGFGTTLMQALARQIHGDLVEHIDERGTRVVISVPGPVPGQGDTDAAP